MFNRTFKKMLALVLVFAALASIVVVPTSAATVNSAFRTPITGYIIATNNKTARAYSSASTSTPVGWIYSTDSCRIVEVYTNGFCRVIVPWLGYANGRTVYTQTSNFFGGSGTSVKKITVKSPAYSRSDLKTRIGYGWVGDQCIILAESGNYYQTLTPWDDSTYKLCWIAKSAFGSSTSVNTGFNPVWPCANARYISTMYRYYNNGNPKNHGCRSNSYNAIDIAGSEGDSILAIESGKVVENGYSSGGFGYYVVIEHGNGLRSLYGHLREASKYTYGETISKAQVIGFMGSTGNSSGPHLHLEVYYPNSFASVVDPFAAYYKGKVNVTIGGNSYRANSPYTSTDSRAKTWCSWLVNSCKKNSAGDYVFTK